MRPRSPGYYTQRALAVAVFIGIAFVITYFFGLVLGFGGVMAINAAVVIGTFMWVNNQGLLALRSVKARRLKRDEEPRLWNITLGLAADLKKIPPALFVVEDGGPNAMACMARGPALAVTKSLLKDYTRTELEAVVAHCLARLPSADLDRAALGISLGPLGSRTIPAVGYEDDVRAVASTRYPPALASAIEKAEPKHGRYAPFWFSGAGPSHRPIAERLYALGDL